MNPSRTQSNVSVLSTNQKICFVLLSAKFLRPRTVYNSLASRKLGKVFHPQKNSSPSNCTKKKSLYLFTAVTPFVLSSLINLFGSKKVNVTFFLVFTHFLLKNLLKGNIDFAIRFHIARWNELPVKLLWNDYVSYVLPFVKSINKDFSALKS